MAQLAVAKWGNSLAVRLPRHVAEDAKLVEGMPVELSVLDGKVVVTPVRRKFKLAELLAQDAGLRHDEVDWGGPVGDEAW